MKHVFVWIWLPGATEPVAAGRLVSEHGSYVFNYGRTYLARHDCIPIFQPELPLRTGLIDPKEGLSMAGCLRDASPDAWGRRVIHRRRVSPLNPDDDKTELGELTYLLESGSDRIGSLDFQRSASEYLPRTVQNPTLMELQRAMDAIDADLPLTPEPYQTLLNATPIGGARPKALYTDSGTKFIAKFMYFNFGYNMIKWEYVAMRLARIVGLDVSPVRLAQAGKKDVLLVERFDRVKTEDGWTRKAQVSALTLFGLAEMMAEHASYQTLAEIIRLRFKSPKATLRELFGRLVFNIICGNTDDHARNHAAFWDGKDLSLTPAYDVCPQIRIGNEATQAMLIVGPYFRSSLALCLKAAPNFLLSESEAKLIIEEQITTVRNEFDKVCAEADLSGRDRKMLQEHVFLNESIFEGYPCALS